MRRRNGLYSDTQIAAGIGAAFLFLYVIWLKKNPAQIPNIPVADIPSALEPGGSVNASLFSSPF